MTKEQLQFFYDEIMGELGWGDEEEESGVDPLIWAKKAIRGQHINDAVEMPPLVDFLMHPENYPNKERDTGEGFGPTGNRPK